MLTSLLIGTCLLAPPVRVACMGDSITHGGLIAGAYPHRLQQILGKGFVVGNFGVSGSTVGPVRGRTYLLKPEFDKAKGFNPDVVVLLLGVNDTIPANWPFTSHRFAKDLEDLVSRIRKFPSKPKTFMATPLPVFVGPNDPRTVALNNEVIPAVRAVAAKLGTPLIDLNTEFQSKADLIRDGIHPNAQGYAMLADVVAEAIAPRIRRAGWQILNENGEKTLDLKTLNTVLSVPGGQATLSTDGKNWAPFVGKGTQIARYLRFPGLDAVQASRVFRGRDPHPTYQEKVPMDKKMTIAQIDLDGETARQTVVDREKGQYLGHVTTCLLDDGKTIIAVYPKGHGRGQIVMKKSFDGGKTWTDRLPVPENWSTSMEVPTIHRTVDPKTGKKRIILWSGLYPARLAVSEDEGETWSPLQPVGEWGGIVVMGSVERLRNGEYAAWFHDDGRFFTSTGQSLAVFTLFQTNSKDGGLTWSVPKAIWEGSDVNLCEPGSVRSPDGKQLALLLRENARRKNSFAMFSDDEGETWTRPVELPASLTGDRHTAKYTPDGRLVICFRDMGHESPTKGDWILWVGTYEDIVKGREGQYRVRLKDNVDSWDSTYPGVEVLPDGTIVATTYGHWTEGEEPYILSVRLKLSETDRMVSDSK